VNCSRLRLRSFKHSWVHSFIDWSSSTVVAAADPERWQPSVRPSGISHPMNKRSPLLDLDAARRPSCGLIPEICRRSRYSSGVRMGCRLVESCFACTTSLAIDLAFMRWSPAGSALQYLVLSSSFVLCCRVCWQRDGTLD
jgi:hypothetical protein